MLRITELRLPLDHAPDALRAAILARLRLADADLLSIHIFRRSHDARKKSAVVLIYTVDCELRDEAAVHARFAGDAHVRPTPDTGYRSSATRRPTSRPWGGRVPSSSASVPAASSRR